MERIVIKAHFLSMNGSSSSSRSRKPRRQGIHGCSPETLPIGDLSLKEEFRTGMSSELRRGDGGKNLEEDMKREAKKAPLVVASSSSSSLSSSSSCSLSSSAAEVSRDVAFSLSSSHDGAVSGDVTISSTSFLFCAESSQFANQFANSSIALSLSLSFVQATAWLRLPLA